LNQKAKSGPFSRKIAAPSMSFDREGISLLIDVNPARSYKYFIGDLELGGLNTDHSKLY